MIAPQPRSSREPIFNLPNVVLGCILLLLGIHAIRSLALSDLTNLELLLEWAVVPARWAVAYGGVRPEDVIGALERTSPDAAGALAPLAHHVLSHGGKPWTGLTYALLHGSWTHVVLNTIWLAAFGTPVARRFGPWRFLALAAAAAFGGAVAFVVVNPLEVLPMVGASAAVSGMMAAAAWFMFSRPIWLPDGRPAEPHERARESLGGLVRNRNVTIFLLVWLATNYLSAVLAQPLGITDASIAWEAHVGGFLVGLVLFPLMDPHARGARRRLET
jgi:membrane associated rhomboid family serine protease